LAGTQRIKPTFFGICAASVVANIDTFVYRNRCPFVVASLESRSRMAAPVAKHRNGQKLSRPGRPRSDVADRAILAAALKLFVEEGLDGANFDRIAKTAGVARTTIYRRFTSREALIARAIEEARGLPEEEAIATQLPLDKLGQRLAEAIVETVTAFDYRKIVARLVGSVPEYPELMTVYWNHYILPRRDMARQILERARNVGLVPADRDTEMVLDLIGGAIMYHLLIRPGHRSKAEIRTYLLRVFREIGLNNPAGRRPRRTPKPTRSRGPK
jgi:AcrR family transcriptional regulator